MSVYNLGMWCQRARMACDTHIPRQQTQRLLLGRAVAPTRGNKDSHWTAWSAVGNSGEKWTIRNLWLHHRLRYQGQHVRVAHEGHAPARLQVRAPRRHRGEPVGHSQRLDGRRTVPVARASSKQLQWSLAADNWKNVWGH